ncbi:MAG: hypothetical protein ABEI57_01030, partial [Halapricum sp.]
LAGTPDAGTEAFAYTHAARLLTAKYAPHYTDSTFSAAVTERIPGTVYYITLNHAPRRVLNGMDAVLSPRQFNVLVEHLEIMDFSEEFFDLSPVPNALRRAADETQFEDLDAEPGSYDSFERLLNSIASELESVGDDAFVIVDSLTAFERGRHFGVDWGDVLGLLEGVRTAASEWGGLVDVIYHARPDKVRSDETINTALDGALYFYTNDQGTNAEKTMRVGDFNGALSRRRQVVYGTEVRDDGFRISSSRGV